MPVKAILLVIYLMTADFAPLAAVDSERPPDSLLEISGP